MLWHQSFQSLLSRLNPTNFSFRRDLKTLHCALSTHTLIFFLSVSGRQELKLSHFFFLPFDNKKPLKVTLSAYTYTHLEVVAQRGEKIDVKEKEKIFVCFSLDLKCKFTTSCCGACEKERNSQEISRRTDSFSFFPFCLVMTVSHECTSVFTQLHTSKFFGWKENSQESLFSWFLVE